MTHPNNFRRYEAKRLVGGELIQYNAAPTPNDSVEWVCTTLDMVIYDEMSSDYVYLFPHNRSMLTVTPETIITVVDTEYTAFWAGYNNEGNDYRGHIHPHSEGPHYVQTGGMRVENEQRRGFYCSAPLNDNGKCIDPPPAYLEAMSIRCPSVIIFDSLDVSYDSLNTGGRFTENGEVYTILGYFTDAGFVHLMYTFRNDNKDGDMLQYVQVWQQVGNTSKWELTKDSQMTVLDCIHFAHKNDGRF